MDPLLDAGFIMWRVGCSIDDGSLYGYDADVNGDGTIDPVLDVGFVMARYGSCL